jgi:hypothetical protein
MSYTRISIHVVAASHFFRFSSSFILKKKRTLTETRLSFLSSSFYSSFFVWPLCLALESWANQSNELLLFLSCDFWKRGRENNEVRIEKRKTGNKKKDKVTQSLSQPITITLCSGMCITTHQPRGRLGWHWMGLISVHESIASSLLIAASSSHCAACFLHKCWTMPWLCLKHLNQAIRDDTIPSCHSPPRSLRAQYSQNWPNADI